jgi:hypothetical protein
MNLRHLCARALPLIAASLLGASAAADTILRTADSFSVLGGSAVTNTGATTLTGNLGVSPTSNLSGQASYLREEPGGFSQGLQIAFSELLQMLGEGSHSAVSPGQQELAACRRCGDPDRPAILIGPDASREPLLDERLDDAAHGWRLDLLGRGDLLQRAGTHEYQHRQRRQLGGANARFGVFHPHDAQHADGDRVDGLCRLEINIA